MAVGTSKEIKKPTSTSGKNVEQTTKTSFNIFFIIYYVLFFLLFFMSCAVAIGNRPIAAVKRNYTTTSTTGKEKLLNTCHKSNCHKNDDNDDGDDDDDND